MIDRGSGPPLVMIPGILGRWEWMAPTVETLSERFRVLSFSLSEAGLDAPHAGVFDAWTTFIDGMLDRAGVASAALIGVSFGGLVAIRYAAARPERVSSLMLVSTPSPSWKLDPQSAFYMRFPHLTMPLLALRSTRRLAPEFLAVHPRWTVRLRLASAYAMRMLRARLSPTHMVHWVRAWMATDITADCARVAAPTVIVTGEPTLDRVVRVDSTLQILKLIPHARHVTFAGTGHVGVVTCPDRFAHIVSASCHAS
jgi:pimeloyl-ACP methyl ester carboxylesterase